MTKNSILDACMASIRMAQNIWMETSVGMVTQTENNVLRFSGESYLTPVLNRFPFEWEEKPLTFKGTNCSEIEEAFYSLLFQEGAEDNVLEVAKRAANAVNPNIKVYFLGDISEIEHDNRSYLRGFYFYDNTPTEKCFICEDSPCSCA